MTAATCDITDALERYDRAGDRHEQNTALAAATTLPDADLLRVPADQLERLAEILAARSPAAAMRVRAALIFARA